MKRFIILSLFFGIMPSLSMFAQDDDLYFVPRNTSKATRKNVSRQGDNAPAYYSGSNRDIDEYNRHGKYWSHYQVLGSDSLGILYNSERGWEYIPILLILIRHL